MRGEMRWGSGTRWDGVGPSCRDPLGPHGSARTPEPNRDALMSDPEPRGDAPGAAGGTNAAHGRPPLVAERDGNGAGCGGAGWDGSGCEERRGGGAGCSSVRWDTRGALELSGVRCGQGRAGVLQCGQPFPACSPQVLVVRARCVQGLQTAPRRRRARSPARSSVLLQVGLRVPERGLRRCVADRAEPFSGGGGRGRHAHV